MNSFEDLADALSNHLHISRRFLQLLEREHQSLRKVDPGSTFEFYQERTQLLPQLNHSLAALKKQRSSWEVLDASERDRHPAIVDLLRDNQDLLMKLILLDRENEQTLLRRGLVPANHLPAANRQRPHFVADLYRRHHTP